MLFLIGNGKRPTGRREDFFTFIVYKDVNMFRTKLGFFSALVLVFLATPYTLAMSSISTVYNAKRTFDLAQVLVKDPSRIVVLKTDIDALYTPIGPLFTGLNNKVVENMQNGPLELQNTIVKPVPINGVVDGGYSITTEKAGLKACLASKEQYGNGKLAVLKIIINGVENGRCEIFHKNKISLIFD